MSKGVQGPSAWRRVRRKRVMWRGRHSCSHIIHLRPVHSPSCIACLAPAFKPSRLKLYEPTPMPHSKNKPQLDLQKSDILALTSATFPLGHTQAESLYDLPLVLSRHFPTLD